MEPWMAADTQNGGIDAQNGDVEAQNGGLQDLQASGRRFASPEQDPDPGSHGSEKLDPDPHLSKSWIRIRI